MTVKLPVLRIGGLFVILISFAAAIYINQHFPALAQPVNGAVVSIAWYIGKLLGKPLDPVIVQGVTQLKPEAIAQVLTTLASEPPPKLQQIMASIPPMARHKVIFELGDTERAPAPESEAPFLGEETKPGVKH